MIYQDLLVAGQEGYRHRNNLPYIVTIKWVECKVDGLEDVALVGLAKQRMYQSSAVMFHFTIKQKRISHRKGFPVCAQADLVGGDDRARQPFGSWLAQS